MLVFTRADGAFRGIPTALRTASIPVVFYDGDVPMSLPEFGGMDTGFNYYHGADPSEYDLVLSNSEGGIPRLLELGARRAEAVYWAADRSLRAAWRRRRTSSSTATATSSGASGCASSSASQPAAAGRPVLVGRARLPRRRRRGVGDRRRAVQRLRAGDRGREDQPEHDAALLRDRPGSSTCRPFELASAGAAIVSNPHAGIERWFEPGSELLVVENADEAVAAYRSLLDDPGEADGPPRARARPRRAPTGIERQVLELLNLGARRPCMTEHRRIAIVPARNEAGR